MRDAVLKTVAYFDIFDYPLTTLELWKFLISEEAISFNDFYGQLENNDLAGLGSKNGFWFLRDREDIIDKRLIRYRLAEKKYRKAMLVSRFLRFVPGVKMIAVCNTLAWSHSSEESDIDLFIVTGNNRLWTSRLLTIIPFALFGLRAGSSEDKNLLCFSFFVTEANLDLSPVGLLPSDPYLVYWLASLFPIYDPDGLMEALWNANRPLLSCLPNAKQVLPSTCRRAESFIKTDYRYYLSSGIFESLAKALQMMMLPSQIRTTMNLDSRVVVTDNILKFHSNDRREEFRQAFVDRCKKLGVM